jgi:hypothetical protein
MDEEMHGDQYTDKENRKKKILYKEVTRMVVTDERGTF